MNMELVIQFLLIGFGVLASAFFAGYETGLISLNRVRLHHDAERHNRRAVILETFVTNPDRTHRNPNLLVWRRRPWLIDHGSALYAHHAWTDPDEHARRPFERIAEHVLLPFAASIPEADARLAPRVSPAALDAIIDVIPDDWLADPAFEGPPAERDAYRCPAGGEMW